MKNSAEYFTSSRLYRKFSHTNFCSCLVGVLKSVNFLKISDFFKIKFWSTPTIVSRCFVRKVIPFNRVYTTNCFLFVKNGRNQFFTTFVIPTFSKIVHRISTSSALCRIFIILSSKLIKTFFVGLSIHCYHAVLVTDELGFFLNLFSLAMSFFLLKAWYKILQSMRFVCFHFKRFVRSFLFIYKARLIWFFVVFSLDMLPTRYNYRKLAFRFDLIFIDCWGS